MNHRRILISFFLLVVSATTAFGKQHKDAPRKVWFSEHWNIEADELTDAPSRFGPGLTWMAGDTIYGEQDSGYKFKISNSESYVVFYQGEQGSGFRIGDSPSKVVALGFSAASPDAANEKKHLPKGKLPKLNGKFTPPKAFEMTFSDLVAELGRPDSQTADEQGNQLVAYNWDCEKCTKNFPKTGLWSGVQTTLEFGGKGDKITYYDVSRVWGL